MSFAPFAAILALPFNVLVVIPALILWFTDGWLTPHPFRLGFWVGLACLGVGLTLMTQTIHNFWTRGRGTLAPWNPTQKLVVAGVYRRVRNPMISGVLFNLLGEALLFASLGIGVWFALFFTTNAIYIPLSEEPGLEKRFGEDYRRYRENVPRWIPRWKPWDPPVQDS